MNLTTDQLHQATLDYCKQQKFAPVCIIEQAMLIGATLAMDACKDLLKQATIDLKFKQKS